MLLLSATFPAHAQQADDDGDAGAISRPVVQSTGPTGNSGQSLNAALARLARDPRNASALVDAGNAAMALGDTDAALGFFTRADQVSPGNGAVKAQIASAMLRGEDPVTALRWFDDAQASGADTVAMASDRGLAYDLVGDNGAAQRQYQLALSRGPNEEATRRYALSLAIAGDRRGAEATLATLVQRQDRAAWRVRTFIMAITGSADDAVGVARASMPADLAAGIAPYLRYMPRLTPAQQAGAANLGRFPRAADIGRDDPRVVQYAALHPRTPRADLALAPQGEALGGHGRDDRASRARRRRPDKDDAVQVALATPPPAQPSAPASPWGVTLQQQAQQQATARPVPTVAQPVVQPVPVPAPVVSRPVVQPTAAPMPPVSAPVSAPVSRPTVQPAPSVTPGFDLARVQGSAPVQTAPAPAPTPAPIAIPQPTVLSRLDMPASAPRPSVAAPVVQPPPPVAAPQPAPEPAPQAVTPPPADFRSLFDGFQPPAEEQQAPVVAVDITRLPPRKRPEPKVEPKVEPKPEAKPAPEPRTAKGKGKEPEPAQDCDPLPAKGKAAKKPVPVKPKPATKGAKAADTCATAARGDRPDGPTAVSRTDEKTGKGGKELKGKDAKEAKATLSHPSRIWVQVLTGSDRDRMGGEWRALVRQAAGLKGKKPFITPWRSNFRLLTGPFDSDVAAQDFL
ncbi:MAG: hypothetical protein RIS94_1920, partial [Pseudomonadota bacterium]